MKKKTVIKIHAHDPKSRSKALETAVQFLGVEQASVKEGEIEVIGDGVDAVELTKSLRKSSGKRSCCCFRKSNGYADLVNVSNVEEKTPDKPPEPKPETPPIVCQSGSLPAYICVEEYPPCEPSGCSIM